MSRPTWIGKKLGGRYLIQELLGQGGMSAVYKAMDQNLNRIVAVKLIHPHLSTDPEFVRRFEEEARAVAQLRHPNIIQVYDFDHDEDVYYIVFEFVPGETLQARLKRLHENGRRMDIEKTISIGAQLADALDYAHGRSLIHRDVKPANVMINVNNDPVLMDFGIVKIMGGTQHTATGAVMGTARYMSPEQIKGERIDERTDLYSLGVVLFEMAGGRPPFEADSAMTIMMMHVNDPVPDLRRLRPDVPPALTQVINKTLTKDKEKRFKRASEIARALRHPGLAATTPSQAAQATVVETAPRTRTETKPEARAETPSRGRGDTGPAGARAGEAAAQVGTGAAAGGGATGVGEETTSGLPRRPLLIGGVLGLVLLAIVCVGGASLLLNSGLLGGGGGNGEETPAVIEEGTPEDQEIALEGGAETEAAQTAEARETRTAATAEAQETRAAATAAFVDAQATSDAVYAASTATAAYAATATQEALPPTQTPTPTATPTPTVPPGIPYARINNIELSGGVYVVDYETFEFTETLPGMHVHFFFDTVPPEQAGVPGSGPWILYGGPRPFQGYRQVDRPAAAEEMCILVANSDHSVQANSGNCYPLPEG